MLMLLRVFPVPVLLMSAFVDILVLERFFAALLKLYKFKFDWPSPIYLNGTTLIYFFMGISTFILINVLLIHASKQLASARKVFVVSVSINFLSVGIVLFMLASKLAVIN